MHSLDPIPAPDAMSEVPETPRSPIELAGEIGMAAVAVAIFAIIIICIFTGAENMARDTLRNQEGFVAKPMSAAGWQSEVRL